MVALSKNRIDTYLGDVVPLRLVGETIGRDSDIKWGVEGDAVSLRGFAGEGRYAFSDGVLISTEAVGEATVFAEYFGERYEAHISVRPMMDSDLEDGFGYYFADMHDHTSMDHNQASFALHKNEDISDYVYYQRRDGRLDMAVISDHAGVTNDYDFFRGFELAEAGGAPVIMAGAESEVMYTEVDRLGVLHRHSGELVTLMSAGYADVATWGEFEECMRWSKYGFAIFAHPHVVGFSTNGIWNFDFGKRNNSFMLSLMRGIEMGNGEDRKENLLHEYAYPAALDAGFRVSTTCASDCHGPAWGYDIMPGKTVIMAKERTKEAFHEAFRKNRFYASESGNVKLAYRVNGLLAPAELGECEEYMFEVELGSFREDESTAPALCQVISDYGKTVYECEVHSNTLKFTIKSKSARYFYLKLIDKEGRKTWSMPVWCSREFDKADNPLTRLTPCDMTGCSAVADGIEADAVIDGDPFNPWRSENATPSIVIDLGKTVEVGGVGYYPLIVLRGKDKGSEWTTSMETRSLVSRYRLYTSIDGKSYEMVADEVARVLGVENIIEFEPRAARYVKMEILGNIGIDSRIERYSGSGTAIGNITIFQKSAQ